MPLQCRDLIKIMENLAHPKHAEKWDKIGLQIGDPDSVVKKVMVSLDVTLAVVEEAIREKVDLLIVHHTPLFNPLETIRWDRPQGKLIKKLVESGINLYCAHTNLDSVGGGVNDILAEKLGLKNIQVLSPGWQEEYYKVVVFVPQGYEDQVRSAMGQKGAGHIGNYSDCTYQVYGTGTFRPLEGTNPFIGEKGQLEKVEEYRIETIVPQERLDEVIKAMIEAHPYEEVAYDIYPLANKGVYSGLGRIGRFQEALTLGQLIEKVKAVLNTGDIRYVGDLNAPVEKIALCGGSGASLIKKAFNKGAQVLITGDIKYHEAQDAESLGLALIDAGHFATEHPVVSVVAQFLRRTLDGQNVEIIESQINTNPIKFFKG
ncbi:MAG: Nif3-like dinuclear metal center hexameric protein [Clostridia bacterium]|nr:Nif3-like dinuclear metal center hexameric protein [Clostridia bacterium]